MHVATFEIVIHDEANNIQMLSTGANMFKMDSTGCFTSSELLSTSKKSLSSEFDEDTVFIKTSCSGSINLYLIQFVKIYDTFIVYFLLYGPMSYVIKNLDIHYKNSGIVLIVIAEPRLANLDAIPAITEINLSWNVLDECNSTCRFMVEWRINSQVTDLTSFTIKNLKPLTAYTVRVTPVDRMGVKFGDTAMRVVMTQSDLLGKYQTAFSMHTIAWNKTNLSLYLYEAIAEVLTKLSLVKNSWLILIAFWSKIDSARIDIEPLMRIV